MAQSQKQQHNEIPTMQPTTTGMYNDNTCTCTNNNNSSCNSADQSAQKKKHNQQHYSTTTTPLTTQIHMQITTRNPSVDKASRRSFHTNITHNIQHQQTCHNLWQIRQTDLAAAVPHSLNCSALHRRCRKLQSSALDYSLARLSFA